MPPKSEFRKFLLPWLMGLLGGALFGLAEAGHAVLAATFQGSDAGTALLLLIGTLSCAIVGGAVSLLVGLALLRASDGRRSWASFLTGLVSPALWSLALWWQTAPPTFAQSAGFHFRGNPWILSALLLLTISGLAVLVIKVQSWRPTLVVSVIALLCLTSWTLLGLRLAPERTPANLSSPNVLWVTLDTARADHMGIHGSSVRTPSYDRVATEGVYFRKAFSQIAVTGPSHAGMMTGTGPWTHGMLLNLVPIPKELTTFPEVMQRAGYNTAAFVSAYVLGGESGFNRGFDLYDDDFSILKGSDGLVLFRTLDAIRRHYNPDLDLQRRGGDTVDEALNWMAQNTLGGGVSGKRPWLLWVHLYDPHGPYTPPPPFSEAYYSGNPKDPTNTSMEQVTGVAHYFKKSLSGVTDVNWVRAQYAGEISYADMQLGRLLGFLDDHALTQNTIVIVNADHGESLGEHEVWFDHGGNLYDPETHVPLAIRYPSGITPANFIDEPVELLDIAPTVLELAKLTVPATVEGHSLTRLFGGGEDRVFARGLCFDRVVNRKIRDEGKATRPSWRLVGLRGQESLYVHREAPEVGDEYYEMVEDPGQLKNVLEVVADDPEATTRKELRTLLEAQAEKILLGMGSEVVKRSSEANISEDQAERLRALGYVE